MKTTKNIALLLTIVLTLVQGFTSYMWGAGDVASGTYVLVTDASDLIAGKKYIIAGHSSNTLYGMKPPANKDVTDLYAKTIGSFSTTSPTETLTVTEEDGYGEFTLGGSSGSWTLSDGSYYLYVYSDGHIHLASNIGNNDGTYSYSWAITFAGGNKPAFTTMLANGLTSSTTNTKRYLKYNTGGGAGNDGLFRSYTSDGAGMYFYKKQETVTLHYGERGNLTYNLAAGNTLPNVTSLTNYAVHGWNTTTKWTTTANKNYSVTTGVDPTPTLSNGATPTASEYWAVYHGNGTACPSSDWVTTKPVAMYNITLSPSSGTNYLTYREEGGSGSCCNPGATSQHIDAILATDMVVTGWTATYNDGSSHNLSYSAAADNSYITFTMPTGDVTVSATFGCPDLSSASAPVVNHTTPSYDAVSGKWSSTISWSSVAGASQYYVTIQNTTAGTTPVNAYNNGNVLSYTYNQFVSNDNYTVTIRAKNQCGVTYKDSEAHAITCVCADMSGETPTISAPSITTTGGKISWSAEGATKYDVSIVGPSPASTVVWSQSKGTALNYTLSVDASDVAARTYTVTVTGYNFCDDPTAEAETTVVVPKTASYYDYKAWCPEPIISISGDVYVTNSYDETYADTKGVMALQTLTISASNLASSGVVQLSTPANSGIFFSAARNVNFVKASKPTATLDLTATDGIIDDATVYVHYKPAAAGTNGNPADVLVTATYQTDPTKTATRNVHVRNLPTQFVIAAKSGGNWYALPANMTSTDTWQGVLIDVNETTMQATASADKAYKLWPVKTTAIDASSDRYQSRGEYLRFTGVDSKALWANESKSSNGIRNNAAISTIGSDGIAQANQEQYEWKVETTPVDGKPTWEYALLMQQTTGGASANTNYLRYRNGRWGTYAYQAANAGDEVVYMLPLTVVPEASLSVMEWGTTDVALKCAASTTLTSVTINGTAVTPAPSWSTLTGDIARLSGLPDLREKAMQKMVITVSESSTTKQKILTIPFIINTTDATTIGLRNQAPGSSQDKRNDVISNVDVIVQNGGLLTVNTAEGNATACTFNDLYIYPGGKVAVSGNDLGVQNVYMRGGFSWLGLPNKGETDFHLPQMNVASDKTLTGIGTSGHGVYYDITIDASIYYMIALPKTVSVTTLTNEENGDDWDAWIKSYSGAGRVSSPKVSGWSYVTSGNLERGAGYEIAVAPRNSRSLGVLRIPLLKSTAWSAETDCAPEVTGWGLTDGELDKGVTANNAGWNYIGNPYFTAYNNTATPGTTPSGIIQTQTLVKHMENGVWNGKYDWKDTDVKYFTIPRYTEYEYDDVRALSPAYKLDAFYPFFIQVTGDGTVSFTASNKTLKAPKRTLQKTEREVIVDFSLTNGSVTDVAGLTISNQYSEGFDMDDKEKTIQNGNASMKVYTLVNEYRTAFNSLPEAIAALPIPVGYIAPTAGSYKFALVDGNHSEVEHIWLTDYDEGNTVDLLTEDFYEFLTNNGAFNERFAIYVVLKPENQGILTDTELVEDEYDQPQKFIYHERMYIMCGGVIYDATGKMVREIK